MIFHLQRWSSTSPVLGFFECKWAGMSARVGVLLSERGLSECECVCMRVCICEYLCNSVCAYTYACLHACVYVCLAMDERKRVCMFAYEFAYACVFEQLPYSIGTHGRGN